MLQPCRQLEPRQLEAFRLLRVSQLDCNQGRNVGVGLPDMPWFNLVTWDTLIVPQHLPSIRYYFVQGERRSNLSPPSHEGSKRQ